MNKKDLFIIISLIILFFLLVILAVYKDPFVIITFVSVGIITFLVIISEILGKFFPKNKRKTEVIKENKIATI